MPVSTTVNSLPDGSQVLEVELSNDILVARFINLGATLWRIGASGPLGPSLCLGLNQACDYLDPVHYIGVTAGPVANRIGGAAFEIDGERFGLEPNEGANQLHGGPTGFSHKLWDTDVDQGSDRVCFRLHRPDGEGGYPGNLEIAVTYQLDGNRLRYQWSAATDRPTPVSLTNHAYWNLAGAEAGTIADHQLEVAASTMVAVDAANIPTGDLPSVADTAFDLRQPTGLGSAIDRLGDGIDHCYVLDERAHGETVGRAPVVLSHPESGRRLEIATTLPGVQVYTGQFLDGSVGAGGHDRHHGLCLETQHLPDAVNQPSFPTCLVKPGKPVTHTTDYGFHLS